MDTRASNAVGIIGSTTRAVLWVLLAAVALGAVSASGYVFAQQPAQPGDDKVLSKDEVTTLVGKIALYPDDLVAIVLPASTYPLQVVEAQRFLDERKKDPSLKPSDKWDDSIVALLNYPEVVKLMNDDLDWTWKLGDAVINQRGDVLDAIQGFRGQAAKAGNLHSDDHQVVQNQDDGAISIKPADPQVVYVPYYEPQQVVVSQPTPVYSYYPYGYPLYYYPYPYGYSFAAGYFWGVTTAFVIGWHSHYVNVVHCGYYGHPYYGHNYYGGYYVRHDASVAVSHGHYAWQPSYRAGAQPFTRSDGRQLAIAHHDANAAGAPSGYRNVERGGPAYHAGSPAITRPNNQAELRPNVGTSPREHAGIDAAAVRNTAPANGGNARDGVKTIQPIHNDRLTQQTIRNELREHSPNQASFGGSGQSAAAAPTARPQTPTDPGHRAMIPPGRYGFQQQSPDRSTAFRAPTASVPPGHTAPTVRSAAPTVAPSAPSPRMAAPQSYGGTASYAYRAPAPTVSHGAPTAGHQGGRGGSQGHAGGAGHGSR
jgi:Protein of unknown function (DUF3300)